MSTQAPSSESVSDVQELTRTVALLAESLARSERRHAHLARSLRWGTLALVALVAAGGYLAGDRLGLAYAQSGGPFPQANDAVQALNNIDRRLAIFGMMGDELQKAMPAIQQAMMSNEDVAVGVKQYLARNKIPVTPENMQTYAAPAVVASAVGTMVDTVVLMGRIREDSNVFRRFLEGPDTQALATVMNGLERELHLMNAALASVPAMAVQMDFMNRNMASMTHSMGSTLGRMGSWMP